MTHFLRSISIFLWLISASFANAFDFGSSFGANSRSNNPEFLPVEQAFVLSVNKRGEHLIATWDIQDGYYLYKHQLKLKGRDGNKLTFSNIPSGTPKTDPYFGDVEVYHNSLSVDISPVGDLENGTELEALIGFQGCAERGLCYPPQSSPIYFTVTQSDSGVSKAPLSINNESTNDAKAEKPIEQNSLQTKASTPEPSIVANVIDHLTNDSWMASLAIMFGLGLLLSLTPCVLPMIPIVSAIVVGTKSSALKGLALSAVYVISMALTYAAIGALAGLFGTQLNLQATLQSPFIISISAFLFLLLSLAMFGVYEIRLPAFITDRLQSYSTKLESNSQRASLSQYAAVALSGVIATLIVSPCVSAPLAGVVLYISSSGDSVYGAVMLFTMALGMGVPLLLVGFFGASILPKNGDWLNDIKSIMGFGLLGVAIWLLSRYLDGQLSVLLWAIFFLMLTSYFIHRSVSIQSHPIRWFCALISGVMGISLAIGALSGARNPIEPFETLTSSSTAITESRDVPYAATIGSLTELQKIKMDYQGSPIVLDLYADWCISCKVIEEEIFKSTDVMPYWSHIKIVRVDVTDNTQDNKQLMQHLNLFGPPSLIFINRKGQEEAQLKIIGEPTKTEVIQRLQLLSTTQQSLQ
ncbi:protein-disulfide reductase DsbD [Marinomonas mediterranea]|uniref:protein-disulfide reductase DsbD n=1 Tax=Marinomonas mediterranea TaxID=119864 RepID=UPI00234B1941|nr:protein-disulfide reductase DsbD [Marinomonas mediterranea]WCN14304.1 protein-disulfide reductase DsbD [Marinomonas mediterranea]